MHPFSVKLRLWRLALALWAVVPFIQACRHPAKLEALQVEHLSCPVGMDNPAPRLSWLMEDPREGACQRSYRILVGTDKGEVEKGEGPVWDSGTVVSDACLVTYAGAPLEPFTRYWWKVVVEEMGGKPVSSEVSFFETGTMGQWSPDGEWIDDGKDIDRLPAPYFRKEFLVEKEVISARAYIASAGFNVLYVNGKRIGDRYLDPAFTRFDESILYTTWDITPEIRNGANALGVLLGNGWYNHQPVAAWSFHTAYWRARPAFRMDIRLRFADGETVTIPTDTSWKACSDGPLIYDNVYTGERYDARLDMDGWNETGFDDGSWQAACRRESPTRKLVSQAMPPVRSCREYPAVSLNKINDTCWVYDFGQNMSGNVSAHIRGKAGVGVALRYGERLYPDGHVDQHNISHLHWGDKRVDPFMTDSLYLGPNGVDFTPEFSYKGFRYVQVNSSEPLSLDENSLTALFIHTDFPEAGCLKASNPLIEKLEQAARMSYLSNYMGYPTDCPQREKNGWTGDAHIAVETGLYNFDAFAAYEKWMADHRENQLPNGVLPDIIPTWGWGIGAGSEGIGANGLDWTSTIALIPWELYLFYGDEKPLRDCYDSIKRYVDFATAHTENLLSYWGRGDWVPVTKKSNPWVIYSTFHFVDCKILSRAATLFDKEEDARYYAELAERVRKAINDKFLDPVTGIYADGMQTSQSFPLFWGVTPDSLRHKVAGKLAEMVRSNGYHIDAGVHGAKAVPNALAMNGFLDEAYRLAVQESYPSWGWWIVNGRTTFLENWELDTGIYSDNHIMFGDIAAWFYRWIGGIQPDPEQPGFKRTILRPGFPDGLDHFSCSHDSPYGTITSGWERSGSEVRYQVTVPPNASALLFLPDREGGISLPAGTHRFKIEINKGWHPTLLDRPVVVKDGVIQPWMDYDSLLVYSMNFLTRCDSIATPDGPKPAYLVTSKFNEDGSYPEGRNRNNQGGNAYFGMKLFRYYYPYFGDIEALRPVKNLLDRMADFLTPDDWAWPGMVRTQDNDNPDGIYLDERIETDKAAMVAMAYLDYARFTGEEKYRSLGEHISGLLLAHTGEGDEANSPLPFRINMRTGEVEEYYTSDMIFVVELYDKLLGMDTALDKADIQAKRDRLLRWIKAYPMRNGRWSGYFEDVEEALDNINQFAPMETARYYLDHPEANPDWKRDVPDLLAFVKGRFGRTVRFGGTSICEQDVCFIEMSSHTARFASVLARWAGETGDQEAKKEALASFALAEYSAYNKYSKGDVAINSTGVGYLKCWFSDSYFDYLPHYFEGMAAWPEMIPEGSDHLFQSSSMILDVSYAPGSVRYTAAEEDGTERLKLSFKPRVLSGGKPLPRSCWSFGKWRDCEGILTIRRKGIKEIEIVESTKNR